MQYFALIVSMLAFGQFASAYTCTASEPACELPQPNTACKCVGTFSTGTIVYGQCQCVVDGNTFILDNSGTWVNMDHLTDCTDQPLETCQSCIQGQC